jgi:hypothetical protein
MASNNLAFDYPRIHRELQDHECARLEKVGTLAEFSASLDERVPTCPTIASIYRDRINRLAEFVNSLAVASDSLAGSSVQPSRILWSLLLLAIEVTLLSLK